MSDSGAPGVALVTGAGRGIGLGIARVLAGSGYRVALADIDTDAALAEAERLAAEGRDALGLELDVTRADAWAGALAAVVARWGGLDLLVLDVPHLFARAGNPYLGPDGRDWPDNARRFAALARAGATIAQGMLPGWRPHVVHA